MQHYSTVLHGHIVSADPVRPFLTLSLAPSSALYLPAIRLASAGHHGDMGHFYEYHPPHTFCTPGPAVCSCPQARTPDVLVDHPLCLYGNILSIDLCRKFHRAMLQVVDKTLGVSFCKLGVLSLLQRVLSYARKALICSWCLCSQQPAKLASFYAGGHWCGFLE